MNYSYNSDGWNCGEASQKDLQMEAVRDRGTEVTASEGGAFQG